MRSLNHENYASKIKFEGGNFTKMQFISQASRLALRSPMAAAVACGSGVLFAPAAYAACDVNATAGTVQCTQNTVTTDTIYPTGGGDARHLSGTYSTPVAVTVADGVTVAGMGLAVTNAGTGGVDVRVDGDIRVDTERGPKTGTQYRMHPANLEDDISGVLAIRGDGGNISVTGAGDIFGRQSIGRGEPLHAVIVENNGSGKVDVDLSGDIVTQGNDVATWQYALGVTNAAVGGDVNVTLGSLDYSSTIRGTVGVSSLASDANVNVLIHNGVALSSPVYLYSNSSGVTDITVNRKINGHAGITVGHGGSGLTVLRMNEDVVSSHFGVVAVANGGDLRVSTKSVEYTGIGGKAISLQQNNRDASGNIDLDVNGVVKAVVPIEIWNLGTGRVSARLNADVIGGSAVIPSILILGIGDSELVSNANVTGLHTAVQMIALNGDISLRGAGNYHSEREYAIELISLGLGHVTTDISGKVTSNGRGGISVRDQSGTNNPGVGGRFDLGVGAVTAMADGAIGIDILTEAASAQISLTSNGDVTANATGILAKSTATIGSGSGNVSVTTNANVTAAKAIELGNGSSGNIVMTQAAGTQINSTASHGILANAASGSTEINIAGTVLANGVNSAGVKAQSTTGDIIVNVAKTGTIDPDFGIDLSTVDGGLVVNNIGLVEGDLAAIRLVATGSGTATITNNGTITSPQDAVQVTLNGGNFSFTNSGVFHNAVNVSGSDVATSTLTNSAAGTANFGTAASSVSGNFVNAGAANIGAGGSVTFLGNTTNSNQINLAGNGLFRTNGNMTNSGMINLANGAVTDLIVVGGSYTGGGHLAVDYNLGALTADQMTIAGDATGATNVVLNRVGPAALLAGGFLPVVTVTGTADANAFTGMGTTIGFVQERFGQNPADAHQFGVLQSVNPGAGSLAGISLIAEAASAALDEPMRPYITGRTDSDGGRGHMGLWMRLGGGRTDQRVQTTISGGPLALVSTDDVRTKFWSAQLGLDYAMVNMGGGLDLHLGVMGGWYSGDSHFGNGSLLKVEAPFAGVYAIVDYGGLSIEASVRREWRRYKALLPALLGDAPREFDGSATAASIYASYRLGGDTGFSATPFVGFQYASADMDDLDIDAQTRFVTDKDKSKVGRAGIRVGYRFGDPASVTIEPFGGVSYLRNWSRGVTNAYVWDTAATTFESRAETWRETVRYSAGLDIRAHHSRVTGFVAANLDDGGRRDGKSVHAGLRLNF